MFAWLKNLLTAEPKYNNQWLAEVAIAGLQHYRGNDLAELIQVGDTLNLEPEPDNDYDENAIMVMWHHNKMGYIPAALARDIRRQMQNDVEVVATIVEIKPVRFGRKWIKIRLATQK